jgi:hypothetical protein
MGKAMPVAKGSGAMRARRTTGSRASSIGPRQAFLTAAAVGALLAVFGPAHAETDRRINLAFETQYYIFDSDYFGLANALGADAALRYEIGSDIYFENGIGLFRTKGEGVSVDGLDYRIDVVALFPVLIPYRPVARFGIGFLSVNPVTVTPTETFRPTQTTFYFLGGAGVTRLIFDRVLVEANTNFWITPYRYRIYRFNRYEVTTSTERFMHISVALGLVYTF